MFAKAYATAASFTKPVIISLLRPDGTCASQIGSFVVLNSDGWILTAGHVLLRADELTLGQQRFNEHQLAVDSLKGISDRRERERRMKNVPPLDANSVKEFSFWWGSDGVTLNDAKYLMDADIGVGRLTPFDPASVANYPLIKDPAKPIPPGTSLCRLGFPFHNVVPTYNNGAFNLPAETFPMVFFPNEGILTRTLTKGNGPGGYGLAFIETSSPGLMGQSGGPIFDREGTVFAIQSHTENLPLGFSPPVPNSKKGEKEHQFLNVGRGTHPETIVGLLNELGIAHSLSTY